jgi:hypothetical protein
MTDKSDLSNKTIRKSLIYGINYLARPLGNWAAKGAQEAAKNAISSGAIESTKLGVENGLNLGHPYAALMFGAADVISENSKDVRNYPLHRFFKLGGAAYFSFLTFKNLVEFASDYTNCRSLVELPFNASMALSLGIDMKNLYNESGQDFFSDVKWVKDKIADSNLVRKLAKRKQEKPID